MSWYWVSLGCSSQRSDRNVVDTRHILILNTRYWIFEYCILNRLWFSRFTRSWKCTGLFDGREGFWLLYIYSQPFFSASDIILCNSEKSKLFLIFPRFQNQTWSSILSWQDLSFSLLFSLDRKVERTCKNVELIPYFQKIFLIFYFACLYYSWF